MTAAASDGGALMGEQARGAGVAVHRGQAVGRHERRPHLVEAGRAARPSWATRARRAAPRARAWWDEGTERFAGRAREQRSGQAAGTGRPRWGHQAVAAERARGAAHGPRHLAAVPRMRRASWHEDVVAGWCSLLMVLGLYTDGGNAPPWLGVVFVGFAATAAWILTRNQRRGAWSLEAVPPGFRLALAGTVLGMVAMAGDAVWHALSGEAHGLAGLVAPFHLVLFAGAGLLAGSVLRAAWSSATSARVPGLRAFWPVALSTTLVVAVTAFFFRSVSPAAAWHRPELATPAAPSPLAGTAQVYELLGLLVHNLLFVAPVCLLLLRWQTPLGTFTVMAGSVALLLATPTGLGLVGAAVLGGAAADVAVTVLRPSPQRPRAARAVAVIAPAVYWTAHFALLRAGYGVTSEPGTWLGSVLWASLSGLTLALLTWPPAVPLTAWNRVRPQRTAATSAPMPAPMVGR